MTLKQLLDELPYASEAQYRIAYNPHFSSSLSEALELYTKARKEALALLYKNKELNTKRPMEIQADFEEVAASCGYFSFSLQDFATEMKAYLAILEELKVETEHRPAGRTWMWLRLWRSGTPTPADPCHDPGMLPHIVHRGESLTGVERDIPEADVPGGVPSSPARKATHDDAPEMRRQQKSFRYRFWRFLCIFRRDDTKFAIKVGVGAALYALPSFLVSTRPFYQAWRAEWGLLSYDAL